MNITDYLIEKYNVPVPRYTSYPPANFFTDHFGETDYRAAIEASNEAASPQNISLYLHIPFCSQLCHYCGCNTHITRNAALKADYVKALKAEIALLAPLLKSDRQVTQIHWGGGTPNSLTPQQIGGIMETLHNNFRIAPAAEIAIECNPAHLDAAYVDHLLRLGFNRISLGVQDFDHQVLKTVNREIPTIPIEELMAQIQASGKAGVNLDFIYGLPLQTLASFEKTIGRAIALRPDRLVTFSYAHVPNIKKSQRILEKAGLVPADVKIKIFEQTYRMMQQAGYVAIGLDHFAKPADELSQALHNRTLHRNFQGYCTRETTGQVYALGTTGISQLAGAFAQNSMSVTAYMEGIGAGRFTTVKGHVLTLQEKVVGEVIASLMCNYYVNWDATGELFGMTGEAVKANLHYQPEQLDMLAADGLIQYTNNFFEVTEIGRFFVRNIVASLDVGLNKEGKTFSKAL